MIEFSLFLGIPLDRHASQALDNANSFRMQTFVNNDSDYLHKATVGETSYLGKYLSDGETVTHCDLLEANIYSLLATLTNEYDFYSKPLLLIPIKRES